MKIKTLDTFIQSYIPTTLSNEEYEKIQKAVLLYLLREIDSKEYIKLTQSIPAKIRTTMRKGVKKSTRLRCLKLGILKMLKFTKISKTNKAKTLKDYQMYKTDWNAIVLLFNNNLIQKVRDKIKNITIPTLVEIEQEADKILIKLKKNYIESLVNKKLVFLMRSQCMDSEDFVMDLTLTGLMQYNFAIPFINKLHLENSMKTKIKTESNNIISYFNKPKRARLVKEGDNFIYNTASINVCNENGEDTDLLNLVGSTESCENTTVIQKTASSILKRFMRPNSNNYGTKYEALNLLMEKNSSKFVGWFNSFYIPKFQRNKKPCKTTEQIAKSFRKLADYKEVIRKYFNATLNSWNMFMKELKSFI